MCVCGSMGVCGVAGVRVSMIVWHVFVSLCVYVWFGFFV